ADDVAAQAEAAGLLLGVLARGEARANLLHRPAPIGSSRWWSYSLPHSSTQTSAASSRSRARTRLPPASASIDMRSTWHRTHVSGAPGTPNISSVMLRGR